MPKQPTSFRLSEMTTRQLTALIESTGLTQSEVMSTAIDRMYQQEIVMNSKSEYNVWASNDQGASTTVAKRLASISACERQARSELGAGWTVHIEKVLTDENGDAIGTEEVKSFRLRK